ncbi:DUF1178 family protein [Bradyrhizobium sp. U87765 SZCCT0131]|uniref:DUF1178 family protein n=1 Tax=unclassified Bradyrhizobium TaxID=2631580 RepID=UPI001BACE927|nr:MULTISPECIES: DUF1178 family protein [unclassified Bradyrhizobium]MBR1217114.1 DUF1178 family protein [Bradyrhizobium sp. U87765 SZCCT0131]MBR1259130.1 DUF1178 family protein [Bradyrhizobium sp. U87765 SZCCT0134]MBR1305271.1 DUF1178 family protein [Bradyrhizobium sp. U87765 SZCCT0110]MBR1321057.1 DUF1178 family protein [Bradyrhizobium sp. U87765 SZCCT0109]MBR1350289.1 DUF1178 family protein [Bradyrhizobium sp. U87765 SZCCT0048]
MIRYTLRCDKGHNFESWFQDSAAYDSQRKRKLVACPTCDSTAIEKALMAPQLTRKSNAKAAARRTVTMDATPVQEAPPEAVPLVSAQELELRAKLKELRDHIVSQADNVGDDFPTEARKMHYGDIEHRPIYGEATVDEARSLIEEGIEVAPLPVLPDDRN